MSYDHECSKIQEFIDEVEGLIAAIEGQEMSSDFFNCELEAVKNAKRIAESELEDIRSVERGDIQDAFREASRVKDHLHEALTDINDCIIALGG